MGLSQSPTSITGRIGNANLPLGAQLYDNAGTPKPRIDAAAGKIYFSDGITVAMDFGTGAGGGILFNNGLFSLDPGGGVHDYSGVGWDTGDSGIYMGGGTLATNLITTSSGSTTGRLVLDIWRWQSTDGIQYFDNTGFHGIGSVIAGTKTATGTATTTFTVTIGVTMADATYKVTTEGDNALSAAVHYVNNKTTTTFDIVYLAGLTGSVSIDWIVSP